MENLLFDKFLNEKVFSFGIFSDYSLFFIKFLSFRMLKIVYVSRKIIKR